MLDSRWHNLVRLPASVSVHFSVLLLISDSYQYWTFQGQLCSTLFSLAALKLCSLWFNLEVYY